MVKTAITLKPIFAPHKPDTSKTLSDCAKNRFENTIGGVTVINLTVFALSYVSGLPPFHNIKGLLYSSTYGEAAAVMQSQAKILFVGFLYLLIKIHPEPKINLIILFFGVISLCYGLVKALTSNDFMRCAGFVAVSQMGLIAIGFGVNSVESVNAALFHLVNDIIYMSGIFLVLALVYRIVKSTEMKPYGLMERIPATGVYFGVLILAACGVPPFNGFQSEFRLIISMFKAGLPELGVLIIFSSVATFVALSSVFSNLYWHRLLRSHR
jgi:energy-converting hydrogenase B subunit F